MTQVTPEQMQQAWGVLLAAILFVMVGVGFAVEKKVGKLVAVLVLLPGTFCLALWAVAAVRYVLGVGNA